MKISRSTWVEFSRVPKRESCLNGPFDYTYLYY